METYATALSYAIPGFLLLILLEALIAPFRGMQVNYGMDTISSLSSGMTNTLKSLLGLSVVIISYDWLVSHLALFEIKATWLVYLLGFIGIDFAAYWAHRWNHEINLFWNRHIVHHSSEEFNLACALRQSISDVFGVYFFLYVPLALIGIPVQVVALLAPIHLFAQFWYHTRLIDRMGILEHILVTPAHHRVHHAINPQYLDKNYAAIFILWDKWFGTFQEELAEVPPVYGTKRPAGTWNPILINFMHFWLLVQDAWHTRNWWDKLRLWFMPTGWRPADVQEKYPVQIIEDPYRQQKYRPESSPFLQYWSWAQLIINFLLMYHLLISVGDLSFGLLLLYAGFLTLSIFAYTTLMDRHRFAFPAELLKFIAGLGILYFLSDWFGLRETFPAGIWLLTAYLLASVSLSLYFSYGREPIRSVPGT
jgi:sterol desaturase/sphingolipid hydroxylase (fatty acid hydroxylase superfamily)